MDTVYDEWILEERSGDIIPAGTSAPSYPRGTAGPIDRWAFLESDPISIQASLNQCLTPRRSCNPLSNPQV